MNNAALTDSQIADLATKAIALTDEWAAVSGLDRRMAFQDLWAAAAEGCELSYHDEALEAQQEANGYEDCDDDMAPGEVKAPEMAARAKTLLEPLTIEGQETDAFFAALPWPW